MADDKILKQNPFAGGIFDGNDSWEVKEEPVMHQAAALPDSEQDTAPTTAEFNALLDALRDAGIMAEPEAEGDD